MKKIVLAVFMILGSFSCYAQITKVEDMKQVFDTVKEASSETLVIFDVDMVLVQPSDPAFQMANMKQYSAISKRVMKEVPAEKQMVFLSLMTTGSDSVLIDDRIPQFLHQIMHKGIPVMALTANLTGKLGSIQKMEQWRVDSLRRLGIDFSKTAPFLKNIVFEDLGSYRGNYSTYTHGILFVNGTSVSKGEAFLSFLAKSDFFPNKVIFIDDREDNLNSMETSIKKLGKPIEYQGFHYLGAQKYPSKIISEEEFESKWHKLASQAMELN